DLAQALVSPGRAERRADLDRRAQRDSPGKPRRGRAAPPYRSGVSGISPVGAPQHARQCRARGASRRRVPARQPHQSLSAAARARPQRALRCAPAGAFGRRAAAGRHRPRADQRSGADSRRRAHRQRRRRGCRRDHEAPAAHARARRDDRDRDPRSAHDRALRHAGAAPGAGRADPRSGARGRAMKIFFLAGLVLRQVGASLRRLFWTHALTAATTAIALFVFGAFLLFQTNLEYLVRGWGEELQVSAYLNRDVAEERVGALLQRIEAMPEVARARYISHAQARGDFQAALGARSGLLDGLPPDALPASVEIALKPAARSAESAARLAARLKQDRDIAEVEYPQQWAENLDVAALIVGWAKWVFGGILFLAVFFVVRSTVRLALFARQDEVEILQLVGASQTLIEAPFVIEGMIQGL